MLKEAFCNNTTIIKTDDLKKYVDYPVNKFLVVGRHDKLVPVQEALLEHYSDVLDAFYSEDYFLEVVPKGVAKDKSLQQLLGKLSIKEDELIACGDGMNDIPMLKIAGVAAVMDNAYEEVKKYAQYADLDTIYKECDLLTLHMPLEAENAHLLDAAAFAKMKDGGVIINTARGGLIDTKALINALENEKVGAVGLDVIEDEFGMYYYDRKSDILSKKDLYILRGFPNVIVTPHMAFYTDQAVSDMVKNSLLSCILHSEGKEDPWKVL